MYDDSHLLKLRGHMELTCNLKLDMCWEFNLNTEWFISLFGDGRSKQPSHTAALTSHMLLHYPQDSWIVPNLTVTCSL